MNVHNKIIPYNFPTYDSKSNSKLPKSFLILKILIPFKLNEINSNSKINKIECESILDCGSYCNFISTKIIKKLNLTPIKTKNILNIIGISGHTKLNYYIPLIFQFKIYINRIPYLITYKEKFIITDQIPTDFLFSNKFMRKFDIHYNYKNNYIYSNSTFKYIKKLLKNFSIQKINNKFIIKNSSNLFTLNNLKNKNNSIKAFVPNSSKSFHNFPRINSNLKLKNSIISSNYYINSYIKSGKIYKNKKFNFSDPIKKIFKNSQKIQECSQTKNSKSFQQPNYHTFSKKYRKNYLLSDFSRKIKPNFYKNLIFSFLADTDEDFYSDDDDEDNDINIEDIPIHYRDVSNVFSKSKADKLPPHRPVDCKIVLEDDATLHYGPIYPLSEQESQALKEYIDDMLKKGFIRPSESPAGYPVLFRKKKDGSLRPCIDYKKLNEVTVRNSYPIPLISDIIERVRGAKFFTKLDLRSAYNLIRIREGDEYKTAFRTKYGHYEYLVMPFGLKNAPATFQSFINSVLRPFLEKFVILYLDDILIFSSSLDEHHNHVHQVLEKLLENNLFAKLEKCEFDKSSVEFLGHILSGEGISTDPKKIKSIQEWPTPECTKDVQRFIGLCNFYRRFVKNFSTIARPLHQLTKKNIKFNWNQDCENAFSELKSRLTTSPVLLHPDPQKPFIVECDASNFAVGSILSQKDEEGKLHPVAYYSRSLHDAELNYSITEKELLAIRSAFITWRHLLLGAKHKITVYTDHRNLIYTLGGKIGNQRQHRWHLFFQEYNFQLIYRQGTKNGKPDSLSRRPDYMTKPEVNEDEFILDIKSVKEIPSFVGVMSSFIDEIIEATKEDETAKNIYLYFDKNNAKQGYFYKPFRKMNKFKIKNNMILYNDLIYIPEKLRLKVLTRYHEEPAAGHLGIRRTEEIISRNFWWPKMHKDVADFINSCEVCARSKVTRHKTYGLLNPLETPDRPWRSIEIDFLCGLPNSNNYSVIMVVVDRFSKMIHLIPFKDIPDAKSTAKAFLQSIFRIHGLPSDIYTDRGSQFTSALWQNLMEELGIKSKIATTDHHETVGQVERVNSYIEQYLRCYSRSYYHDDWSNWLYLAEFAYNNAVHESTKQSPFFINYGFHPPMDDIYLFNGAASNYKLMEDVSKNFDHIKDILIRTKDLYKRAADKKRITAPMFKEGDKVWIHAPPAFITDESPKLAPTKYGPYKIIQVLENNNYKIDIRNSPFPKHHPIFHISELEPFIPTPERFSLRSIDNFMTTDIIEITGFRVNYKKNQYEYKVRYKHRNAYNWVPASKIEDDIRYQDLLMEFNRTKRRKPYERIRNFDN